MKSWIQAFRLRTLPLAFSGWLVGISLTANAATLNYTVAGLTLLTAVFLQILSNLANDYGDATSGVDEKRTGEVRMVSSGQISSQAMKKAMIVFSLLSLASGSWLLYLAFPNDFIKAIIFLLIGLIGIAAAIKYTVGKNPYGYAGFGDIFVFVFFGLVLVFGTYYLQVQRLDWLIFLPAASLGLFSVGVLNVNNIRDIESDKAAGKNSIPVRIGRVAAVRYHSVILVLGLLLSALYVHLTFSTLWGFLFLMVGFLFQKNIRAVSTLPSAKLDPYLKQMAISTLLFAVLFSVGQLVSLLA
ncbi:1,4-dihydroxy-2-naphthoate octaprenyltransferase [Ekhidna sp.]|jgi:1,4-dihydroxy-2-naphthoate octaprenyltransferase|uniref:1,4-dihydroxy-2-naphthoate octaprenyltransferase n=1 Tax=Ekhidna sp. TaxID=2608089 RepID=UPI0032EAE330